jgi:hypothetical protein
MDPEKNFVRAIERSIKLSSVLSGLLKEGPVGEEIEGLIRNLRVMFPSQEELRSLFSETEGQEVILCFI